jgi:hypothetical protein
MLAPEVGLRFGDRRIAWPSGRGATELSTVEWQNAQLMPTRRRVVWPPSDVTVPSTPSTICRLH